MCRHKVHQAEAQALRTRGWAARDVRPGAPRKRLISTCAAGVRACGIERGSHSALHVGHRLDPAPSGVRLSARPAMEIRRHRTTRGPPGTRTETRASDAAASASSVTSMFLPLAAHRCATRSPSRRSPQVPNSQYLGLSCRLFLIRASIAAVVVADRQRESAGPAPRSTGTRMSHCAVASGLQQVLHTVLFVFAARPGSC
jgi:hypothetical protein